MGTRRLAECAPPQMETFSEPAENSAESTVPAIEPRTYSEDLIGGVVRIENVSYGDRNASAQGTVA